jgi:NADPH:quinone reductase-like Zn-dependent oxidoreductase
VRFTHTFTDPRLRASNVAVISQATNASAMAWLAEKLAEGVITARVAKQVPMREAAEAHRLVEAGGLRGRVVLTF